MMRASLCLCLLVPVASLGIFPAQRKQIEDQKKQALTQKAATVVAAPALSAHVEIPEPVDVGADGFPALPAVNQIMGQASKTLKTVSSGANDIVGRMVSAQKQSESELGRQKHAFEGQLKAQEVKNQAVVAETQKITNDIDILKTNNVQLRKKAHETQKKITVLRSVVHTLQSRMNLAEGFAAKSMLETDDSKQPVLKVLLGEKGPDDDFLRDDRPVVDDDDEEDSADEVSLLAISSTVHKAATKKSNDADLDAALSGMAAGTEASQESSPDAILNILSKDVATLVEQRKQSVAKLKNLFIRDYRAGAKRHLALLNQQKVLRTEMEGLQAVQTKLKTAVAHLQGTHSQLQRKLKGLGQFLQKLAHVANAPEPEVTNLLDNLPRNVNVAKTPII